MVSKPLKFLPHSFSFDSKPISNYFSSADTLHIDGLSKAGLSSRQFNIFQSKKKKKGVSRLIKTNLLSVVDAGLGGSQLPNLAQSLRTRLS